MTDEREIATQRLHVALGAITAVKNFEIPETLSVMGTDESYEAVSGGVVRPNHALRACKDPDDLVWLEYGDSVMFIATRRETAGGAGFVLIAVGGEIKGQMQIHAAYRLYPQDRSVEELSGNARAAFTEFLRQHAIVYYPDEKPTFFSPAVKGPAKPDRIETARSALGVKHQGGKVWVLVTQARTRGGEVMFMFPFAVDKGGYQEFARERGWKG